MLCKESLRYCSTLIDRRTYFVMNTAYSSQFETVFLCTYSKGSKISREATAKHMRKSKAYVNRWVKRYLKVKNIDDLSERGFAQKMTRGQTNLTSVCERSSSIIAWRESGIMSKKYKYIIWHNKKTSVKYQSTIKGLIHLGGLKIIPYFGS